jgi:hypothetical protein
MEEDNKPRRNPTTANGHKNLEKENTKPATPKQCLENNGKEATPANGDVGKSPGKKGGSGATCRPKV